MSANRGSAQNEQQAPEQQVQGDRETAAGARRRSILQDAPWTLFVRLSLPGIAGMLVISLNNFVDALFLGRYVGSDAVAAIGLAFPLTLLTAAFTSLISVGSSSLLSRAIGEGDPDKPGRIAANVLWLCLFFTAVLTAIGLLFADPLIQAVGGRGEQAAMGAQYFRIFVLATIFRMPALSGNMLIRAEGRLKEAMTYVSIAMASNMVLDAVFVAGLGWGIEGAAWATNASMLIYVVLNAAYYLRGQQGYAIRRDQLGLHRDLLPDVLGVGISASMMQFMFLVQNMVVFQSVTRYGGPEDTAFMAAAYRIIMLAAVPVFGFIQAFQPVVGIHYGAGYYRRLLQVSLVFLMGGTLFELALWTPMMVWPEAFLGLLLPDVLFSVEQMVLFRAIIGSMPLLPLLFLSISFFQSMGMGRIAGMLIGGRQVFFFVPIVLLMAARMGLAGIYWGHLVVDALSVLLSLAFVLPQWGKLQRMAASAPAPAPASAPATEPAA
jgi:putative MATE family efflux protein